MSFQQKFIATCFLTTFMLGATWLLLAATILLNHPISLGQEANHRLSTAQRIETIEVLKEPIIFCRNDIKNEDENCIPLEMVSSEAESKRAEQITQSANFAGSTSSTFEISPQLHPVAWENKDDIMILSQYRSQISTINNSTSVEDQNSASIKSQDKLMTQLADSNSPIPQKHNHDGLQDITATSTSQEGDVWESINKSTESPSLNILTEQITKTETVTEVADDDLQANLAITIDEANLEAIDESSYFTHSFFHYWFSQEGMQE